MKIGLIIFHKDFERYDRRWIKKFSESIINQTFDRFKIYEINYGGKNNSIFSYLDVEVSHEYSFFQKNMENHVYAMNYLLDVAFSEGCDFVFNTNIDDYYDLRRIERQLPYLEKGVDICSTDFCYVRDNGGEDLIKERKRLSGFGDIKDNFNQGHNVISHPSVAYSRKIWDDGNRYDVNIIPEEDFTLWKKLINDGYRFEIVPEDLLYYRLHNDQVSRVEELPDMDDLGNEKIIRKNPSKIQIQNPVDPIRKTDKKQTMADLSPIQPRRN
jgi:hypothetical protein